MAAKIINLKTLALSAAIILAVELGLHWVSWPKSISTLSLIGAARVIEGVWLLGLVHWLCPEGMAAIGLRPGTLVAGLKKGLAWSIGFGVLVLLAAVVLYVAAGLNAFEFMQGGQTSGKTGIWVFLLIGGVISPITEEIVFRGILYGYLRQWGALAAVAVSTVVFVLAHAIQGAFPLTQVVGGIVFAVAYEKEKNLMVPMVIHILGNLAIYAITLM